MADETLEVWIKLAIVDINGLFINLWVVRTWFYFYFYFIYIYKFINSICGCLASLFLLFCTKCEASED